MNPTHLRTFLAVRKSLSYTRAAEEVFLSQPAVSRQVQQLEREMGVALFEQIGKTLHLTEAGVALAPEAELLLARIDRVGESMAAHRSVDAGRLRIGAGTTPGFYLLPKIVGRFHRKHPDVELGYVVENSRAIEQRVLRNEVDIGFIGGPPSSHDVLFQPIARDTIVCFASPAHELASRKRINPTTLSGQTWIVRSTGSATRNLFESWLARAGGKLKHTIELGCPEAVRALVAGGMGVSYMSDLAIAEDVRRNRLAQLPITGLRLKRTINMIWHADKHVSPTIRAFQTAVQQSLRGSA